MALTAVTTNPDVNTMVIDVFQTSATSTPNADPLSGASASNHYVWPKDANGNFTGQVFVPAGTFYVYATAYKSGAPFGPAANPALGRGVVSFTIGDTNLDSLNSANASTLRVLDWALWTNAPDHTLNLPSGGPVITGITKFNPANVLAQQATPPSYANFAVTALVPWPGATIASYSWSVAPPTGAAAGACSEASFGSPTAATTTYLDRFVESCVITITVTDTLGNSTSASFPFGYQPPSGTQAVNVGGAFVQIPVINDIVMTPPRNAWGTAATGTVAAGNTLTIGTRQFTAVTTIVNGVTDHDQFLIGATPAQTATNLANAISLSSAVRTTVSARASGNVVTVSTNAPGTASNGTVAFSSNSTNIVVASLTPGYLGGATDDQACDISRFGTSVSCPNTFTFVPNDRMTVTVFFDLGGSYNHTATLQMWCSNDGTTWNMYNDELSAPINIGDAAATWIWTYPASSNGGLCAFVATVTNTDATVNGSNPKDEFRGYFGIF